MLKKSAICRAFEGKYYTEKAQFMQIFFSFFRNFFKNLFTSISSAYPCLHDFAANFAKQKANELTFLNELNG